MHKEGGDAVGVNKEEVSKTIIELEKSYNERFSVGDPGGYLDGFADEVSSFDPILENIVVGKEKTVAWLSSICSDPHIVRSEYLNPTWALTQTAKAAVSS
ncbi:hypothetical protein P1P75_27580 [Streptomyces sp. ID05-39B]|uniref:hypothetical protein n=1 Tax=Streptomyces sp. ID05-39B TaxID=3028664 RepID=UPI0029AE1299|nr:hypothetical protein [Streptomyces sp. ID05-39B]MDX3530072.1 hypothetical protein [Streptomyces sp. ID05-39B]